MLATIVDVDADGDMDVIASPKDGRRNLGISWFEHVDGTGNFQKHKFANQQSEFVVGDLNGDLGQDVVTPTAWHKWQSTGFTEQALPPLPEGVNSISQLQLFDYQADGDTDILARASDTAFVVFENGDGDGPSRSLLIDGQQQSNPFLRQMEAGDLDLDGDVDLVTYTRQVDFDIPEIAIKFAWHERHEDESYTEHELRSATPDFFEEDSNGRQLAVVDVDGDGNLDVLLESYHYLTGSEYYGWFENPDGVGPTGDEKGLYSGIRSFFAVLPSTYEFLQSFSDVDDDGDLDAVMFNYSIAGSTTRWREFRDGQLVSCECDLDMEWPNPKPDRTVGDVSGDGIPDHVMIDTDLSWIDGSVQSAESHVLAVQKAMGTMTQATNLDLNSDSVVDLVDLTKLIEEVLEIPWGDSTSDSRFDSSDLVQVFRLGQYEDAIPENSDWLSGDWNGDQEFDSSDLVHVFAKGATGQSQILRGSTGHISSVTSTTSAAALIDNDPISSVMLAPDDPPSFRFQLDGSYDISEVRILHGGGEQVPPEVGLQGVHTLVFRDANGQLLEEVFWEADPFRFSRYDTIDVSVPDGVTSIELVLNPMDVGFTVHIREVNFKGRPVGD